MDSNFQFRDAWPPSSAWAPSFDGERWLLEPLQQLYKLPRPTTARMKPPRRRSIGPNSSAPITIARAQLRRSLHALRPYKLRSIDRDGGPMMAWRCGCTTPLRGCFRPEGPKRRSRDQVASSGAGAARDLNDVRYDAFPTRDLLKSFSWGIAALHRLNAATKLPCPRRPIASSSSAREEISVHWSSATLVYGSSDAQSSCGFVDAVSRKQHDEQYL
jgi:hypothetical protein